MKNNTPTKDDALSEEVLNLLDQGKTREEILHIFPRHQKEVQEIFQLADMIGDFGCQAKPSRELLNKIIEDYQVTFSHSERYNKQDVENTSTLNNNYATQLKSIIHKMKNKTKMFVVLGGAAAAVIFILVFSLAFFGGKKIQNGAVSSLEGKQQKTATVMEPREADSNKIVSDYDPGTVAQTKEEEVDLTVEAVLSELDDETLFEDEEGDLAIADLDFSDLDSILE